MAEEFKHFIRIANTDIEGNKPLYHALKKIKGVGSMFANAVCAVSDIDRTKKTGYLTDEEVKRVAEVIKNPERFDIPKWMFNRRKDYDTGEDRHLLVADLSFTKESDIRKLKKIKSYRGIRHAMGLPVRGQRTRSNFRKGKVIGVAKGKKKSGRV